jgi:hypothetical protein
VDKISLQIPFETVAIQRLERLIIEGLRSLRSIELVKPRTIQPLEYSQYQLIFIAVSSWICDGAHLSVAALDVAGEVNWQQKNTNEVSEGPGMAGLDKSGPAIFWA